MNTNQANLALSSELIIVTSATYFVISAGCVIYHVKELLTYILPDDKDLLAFGTWFRENPTRNALKDRRDFLNHGILTRKPNPNIKPYKLHRRHNTTLTPRTGYSQFNADQSMDSTEAENTRLQSVAPSSS